MKLGNKKLSKIGPTSLTSLAVCALVAAGAIGGNASASTSKAAGIEHATAELKTYSALPKWVAPGPAFNISKVKGMTIFSIPVSSSIAFESVTEAASAKLAAKYGIKWIDYTNDGSETQYVQGMDEAIADHVSLIELFGGIDPAQLAPQIKAAKAAGIPVVASHFYQTGDNSAIPSYVNGSISANFNEAARLDADWIIKEASGTAQLLEVESSDLGPPALAGIQGMKSEFSTYCPDCKIKVINVPYADWATDIPSEVSAALSENSGVTYVLGAYDSMSTFIESGIASAGRTGKVHISTYNGTPTFLDTIAKHGAVQMDVGEDETWLAYADLDQEMRILTGNPVVNEQGVLRVFDPSNIASAGNPPAAGVGYGSAYVKGFTSLWKTS
jgi:ribose transport system substrate-binding protein